MGFFNFNYVVSLCLLEITCVSTQLICVHMKDCPVVFDLLKTEKGQGQLKRLICENDARYPKIWCRIPCETTSKENGYCSLKTDCPTANSSETVDSCDLSPRENVCCVSNNQTVTDSTTETTTETTTQTTKETTTETTTQTTKETTTETTISLAFTTATEPLIDSRYSQPDSEICGIQSDTNKVANGKIASMHDHPWSVLLQYSEKGKLAYKCGGTLISNKFVVTAAHCVHKTTARLLNVILGEYNISSEIDCFQGYCMPKPLIIAIRNTIIHPGWLQADRPFYNDIALIELQREVQYIEFIRPICLSSTSSKTKGQLTVSGWGKTEFAKLSDVKRVATLEIQSRSACLNTVRYPLKSSQLCAGGDKADSCDGDSGGPLMQVDFSGPQPTWFLVGVVSLGSGKCGSIGKPAIYTDVFYYHDWILDNIQ